MIRRHLFFLSRLMHRDLQHHHHTVKAVKTTPITRPSKIQLAGRSNQIRKARVAVERELEAQALLHSEEATGPYSEAATGPNSESEEESGLEVSDSGNESDAVFNQ